MRDHIKKTMYSCNYDYPVIADILEFMKSRVEPGLLFVVMLIIILFISGCNIKGASASAGEYYYLNKNKSLAMVGRVSIVELGNDSSYPQVSSDFTDTLYQALQKKQIFGLTIVRRQDATWRSLQLDLDTAYGLEQMMAMRETLKSDGVLIGTVTEFRPYPHMTIGLRLKLLDLTDGQLLWALEQVWDSADKKIQRRMRDYFKSQRSSDFTSMYQDLISVSSIEFMKFVCYEVAETL